MEQWKLARAGGKAFRERECNPRLFKERLFKTGDCNNASCPYFFTVPLWRAIKNARFFEIALAKVARRLYCKCVGRRNPRNKRKSFRQLDKRFPKNFISPHLYFCGFEEAHWRNPCGMACYMFLTSDQTRFFCALRKAQIERNNKKVYNKGTDNVRLSKQLHLNSTLLASNRQIDAVRTTSRFCNNGNSTRNKGRGMVPLL